MKLGKLKIGRFLRNIYDVNVASCMLVSKNNIVCYFESVFLIISSFPIITR